MQSAEPELRPETECLAPAYSASLYRCPAVPACRAGMVVLGEACAPEGAAEVGGAACAKQPPVNSTVRNPAQISFFIPFTSPRQ